MSTHRDRKPAFQTPNLQGATEFLAAYYGDEPWHLTAIHQTEPKGIRDGMTFMPTVDRVQKVCSWISKHTDEQNDLYFSINPLKAGVKLSRKKMKASKDDIEAATHLHVDADPRKLPGVVFQQERKLILERMQAIEPRPTWIIASGNGIWGIWQLNKPAPADGKDGQSTLELEERNIWLAEEVGRQWADDCENVDRIARLPGSINHKAGRNASVVMYHSTRVYELNEFSRRVKEKKTRAAVEIELPDDLPEVDIDKVQIPDKLRKLIKFPEYTKWKGDRSPAVFLVAHALARSGLEPEEIAAVLLNKAYKITDHIFDQKNPLRAVKRVVADAMASLPQPGDEAPAYSEAALAIDFLYRHAHQLRYVAAWRQWLKWDGARWGNEETEWALDLMSSICREAGWEMANNTKSKRAICRHREDSQRR